MRSAFERSTQERALLMTGEYLVDVFRTADTDTRQRTFDYVVRTRWAKLAKVKFSSQAIARPNMAHFPRIR